MSTERPGTDPDELPSPELRAALDAWSPPPARAAFREELRARFVAEGADADRAAGGDRAGGRALPGPGSSRRRFVGVAAALAAAAAVLLLVLDVDRGVAPVGPGGGGAWSVIGDGRPGRLVIDGAPFEATDRAALEARLVGASRIETGAGALRLQLADVLQVEVGAGSVVDVGELSAFAADDAELAFSIEAGRCATVTGPGFVGRSLVVRSPGAEVEVVGTAFGIDVYEEGTCICCTEGEVEVRHVAQGTRASVPAGGLNFVFSDGAPARSGEVAPDHRAPIEALRAVGFRPR